MKVLLVLCLVSCAYSAALEECSEGQSYWCTSLKTAKRCGAVQHCIDNVWSQQAPYKGDVGDVCKFCENLIGDVRSLFNKTNEDKVEKYLDAACDIIPVPELSDRCKDYVNKDMPELFKMIRSKLNPGAVCSAICLCSSYKDYTHETNTLHRVALVKASQDVNVRVVSAVTTTASPDVCKDCEKLVQDIKTAFTDKATESEIENYLKQFVCNYLGPLDDECTKNVDAYLPELMQMIDDQVHPKLVCTLIAFCPGGDKSILPRMRVASPEVCKDCEKLVQDIKTAFTSNATESQIENFLKQKVCNYLGLLKNECIRKVDYFLPELMQMIDDQVDPKLVCKLIAFCPWGDKSVLPKRLTSPEVCKDCEKLVQDIKTAFTDKATEAEIENHLKQYVCNYLGPLDDECTKTVDTYLPELMQMIDDQVDPKLVCTLIAFCPGGDKSILPRMRLAKSPLFKAASKLQGAKECDACKVFLSEMQDLDRNKVLQADLESVLKEKFCPLLGSLKEECLMTVNLYGQYMFEFLANELDPNTRCESLGFCSSNNLLRSSPIRKATPPVSKVSPKDLKQSPQCVLCEFVMDKLESILMNNKSEAEVIAALDKVCFVLPDTLKEECDNFIKTYGPAILDLLLQEISPQVVCTTLGLCAGSKQTVILKKPIVVKSTEQCGICETIIQYLDSLLEENATVADIEKALDKVCSELPGTLKDTCDSFVEQYGPQIVKLIVQLSDPKQVCTELGLCQKKFSTAMLLTPAKANLVGVRKCTYGPKYWCSSMETAKECNAVAHCEKHGWAKKNKN